MEDFSESTKFLLSLTDRAEEIMLKHYSPGGIPADIKEDMSPVTKADNEVNDMVIEQVQKHYPEYGVLAEEGNSNEKRKKLFVVDPVDGTLMLTIGSPLFCFSAAIVIDGKPIAGVISNPLAKRTLLAELNKGAYLVSEEKKISVSNRRELDGALINDEFNDERRHTSITGLLRARGARSPQVYGICEASSLVATGGFDGKIFMGRNAHDVAATKIVVEEAGGKVTNIEGNEQRYDTNIKGALISNGHMHDKLLSIVREAQVYGKPH